MKVNADVGMLIRAQAYFFVFFVLPLDALGFLIVLIKGRPQSLEDHLFVTAMFSFMCFAFLFIHFVRGYKISDNDVQVPLFGRILKSSIVKTERNPWGYKMTQITGRAILVFFDTSQLNLKSST